MKRMIIDRLEGTYAVCENEDKTKKTIPRMKLPPNVKEGDCLIQDEKGIFLIDEEYTVQKKKMIQSRLSRRLEY